MNSTNEIQSRALNSVVKQITPTMLEKMEYGQEIKLDDEFTLYKYAEDELYSLFTTDDWEELMSLIINGNQVDIELH